MGKKIEVVAPDKLNGHAKNHAGIYVPTKATVASMLRKFMVDPDKLPGYIKSSNELSILEVARKKGRAVLFVGPTGVAKTLLANSFAAKTGMPLVTVYANEDMTDGKMRGYKTFETVPIEMDGRLDKLTVTTFSPAPLSLAALPSDEPVVLFIDELHKIREGISSLLHSLTNERELPLIDIIGDKFSLHPDTIVIGSLNPQYGIGIDKIDPALRQRFVTMYFSMPTQKERLERIIRANLDRSKGDDLTPQPTAQSPVDIDRAISQLSDAVADLTQTFYGYSSGSVSPAALTSGLDGAVLSNITEPPSPRTLVSAIEFIAEGIPIDDAVKVNLVNTVVRDFERTANGLMQYFRGKVSGMSRPSP